MKTEKWIIQLDKISGEVKKSFGDLNADQLNLKPAPDRWSIAQCLDHLIISNRLYFPVIQEVRDGTYRKPITARFPFMVNLFGNMILKSLLPESRRKVKTFQVFEPSESDLPEDIVKQFIEHQEELKKVINESGDLIEKNAVISSPVYRWIVYRLSTAYDILVVHEKRHLMQAREVMKQIER